jgi:hypothetical protein
VKAGVREGTPPVQIIPLFMCATGLKLFISSSNYLTIMCRQACVMERH